MKHMELKFYKAFEATACDKEVFQNILYRTTDDFTKCAISGIMELLQEVNCNEINKDSLGILVATSTGPRYSIKDVYSMYQERGYKGINPSLFPNIMMSTVLSRCTNLSGAHGNCATIYVSREKAREQMLEYVGMQLGSGRCEYVIGIYVNEQEGGYCFWAE